MLIHLYGTVTSNDILESFSQQAVRKCNLNTNCSAFMRIQIWRYFCLIYNTIFYIALNLLKLKMYGLVHMLSVVCSMPLNNFIMIYRQSKPLYFKLWHLDINIIITVESIGPPMITVLK